MAEIKRAQLVAAELGGVDGGYFAFDVSDSDQVTQLFYKLASADEGVEVLLGAGYSDVEVYDTANTLEEYADDPRVSVWVYDPVSGEYL